MFKKVQGLRPVTRIAVIFSLVTGAISLSFGVLTLYVTIAEPGGSSMFTYAPVWAVPLMISGGLAILLTIAAIPLNLMAALTEPSMKGKKICYALCLIFLCVLCIALLRTSGIG